MNEELNKTKMKAEYKLTLRDYVNPEFRETIILQNPNGIRLKELAKNWMRENYSGGIYCQKWQSKSNPEIMLTGIFSEKSDFFLMYAVKINHA